MNSKKEINYESNQLERNHPGNDCRTFAPDFSGGGADERHHGRAAGTYGLLMRMSPRKAARRVATAMVKVAITSMWNTANVTIGQRRNASGMPSENTPRRKACQDTSVNFADMCGV